MEIVSIILLIIILIALAAVVVFFLQDYFDHKKDVDTKFETSAKDLETERTDRAGNVKYLIDETNRINRDIYTEFTSNMTKQTADLTALGSNQNSLLSGLDKAFRFSSNALIPGATPGYMSLLNMPGGSGVSTELLTHVTAISGLTAKNLDAAHAFKLCAPASGNAAAKCMEFPNADGNIYLTSFDAAKDILIDGNTSLIGSLKFKSSAADTAPAVVSPASGSVLNMSGAVSISPISATQTAPSLKVKSANQDDLVVVTPAGDITVAPSTNLYIKKGAVTLATISSDGSATDPGLKVKAKVTVEGNLDVNGTLKVNGVAVPAATTTTVAPAATAVSA